MIVLKNASELSMMKEACKLSADALSYGGSLLKPGITTGEIDRKIRDFIERHGATPSFLGYGGFPGSACISLNDTVIHGIPGSQVIEEGDIVKIDVGAFYKGFHGDNAFTFAVGEVPPETKELLQRTRESLYRAIDMARPGNRVGDVSHAVETHVEEYGFSVVYDFTGHGVGRKLHEAPEVPNFGIPGRGPRLTPGMTIAIEPMINAGVPEVNILKDGWTVKTADGKLSAHFEHTIAITPDGPVILTEGDAWK